MSIYDKDGNALSAVYDKDGNSLTYAYDIDGNEIFSGSDEEEWNPTTLSYDTNFLITDAWLTNAATQRDAVKALYQASEDAIPFFIQTDGHGRYNEGNKGCHNLAEETMRYIPNLQLGDYASYYSNGNNPTNHANSSAGIEYYLCCMGNHEFLRSSTDDPIADMTLMVPSYVPSGAVCGSDTYGYYKYIDTHYNIKWLVTQPHIPDDSASSGFLWKILSDQYEWLIDELEANDGYDIVILQHEELNGTITNRSGTTYIRNLGNMDISAILAARKAKTSGSFTDSDGISHAYDFTGCTSDLLCSFHGHHHYEAYITKDTYGFPSYVGNEFAGSAQSCYGLIDRANGKLYIYSFSRSAVSDALVLDL